jgi:hypothetical protein
LGDVLEVDEDALRRLRPEEDLGARLLHGADRRLEHEVELARLRQVALAVLAGPFARAHAALRLLELVGAEAELARPAVDERIREARYVPRRLPDLRVEHDRGIEQDDVVAFLHHRLDPAGADVVLQQDAVVPVVVPGPEAAVDLGRWKDEAPAATQRDDLLHRHGIGGGGDAFLHRRASTLPPPRARPTRGKAGRANAVAAQAAGGSDASPGRALPPRRRLVRRSGAGATTQGLHVYLRVT